MAYDEKLAKRIRAEFGSVPFVEKKMFGGVGFLVRGNTACGVHKQSIVVRVDPNKHAALLKTPHARVFDITGKPTKG
jgi:TfoX/Sxy family transcriptional regulator of competence genes